MMTLEQLRQFIEAARHEHLGKAARAVHVSAGAVSHSISALEEEFGRDLFVKRGKRIYITDHGKLLLEKAERLLADVEDIQKALSTDSISLRGHYRMAATHVLSSEFLLPAWNETQAQNENLTGEVFTLRSSQVVEGVIAGEYDFGLCFNPHAHSNLDIEILHSGQLLVGVRKNHPILKIAPKIQLQEISQFSAALPKAFHGIEMCERHPMFEKFNIDVRPTCLIDSYQLALEKVSMSDSWSLLPDWLIRKDKRLVALAAPKAWDAPYYVAAISARHRVLPRPMVPLKQLVKEKFIHFKKIISSMAIYHQR